MIVFKEKVIFKIPILKHSSVVLILNSILYLYVEVYKYDLNYNLYISIVYWINLFIILYSFGFFYASDSMKYFSLRKKYLVYFLFILYIFILATPMNYKHYFLEKSLLYLFFAIFLMHITNIVLSIYFALATSIEGSRFTICIGRR